VDHELDTLLDHFDGRAVPDSFEVQRLRLAVRARLLDETVPELHIDRYVVRERLGVGGMGVVYAAHDGELDREVAIKLVRGAAGAEANPDQQRLVREARSLAQLAHPNVVSIYDVGLHRDRVFIAMELVRGTTLRARVSCGVTPWQDTLHLYVQAGEGLLAAHAAGLVHRDFKPDNVLVGADGRVRVVDFGLARATGGVERGTSAPGLDVEVTSTGELIGTPAYMAPEQAKGERVDGRADQFSFCVALYEALYGERPAGVPSDTPPRGGVPTRVHAAIRRGLAKSPDDRFDSMDALLRELERPSLTVWVATVAAVVLLAALAVVFLLP
jgi:serine/threonine protein kinase